MTRAEFWAGVFPGHATRCDRALRSVPLEQYQHYGVFRVSCRSCGFEWRAGVSVDAEDPAHLVVDWTDRTRRVSERHQRKSGDLKRGAGRVVE